jgi:hypothetical protein
LAWYREKRLNRADNGLPQPRLQPSRSVCDFEHDLSGFVGRAIQHAVSDLRVCEVENLADGQFSVPRWTIAEILSSRSRVTSTMKYAARMSCDRT